MNSRDCGCIGTVDSGPKCAQYWNQIQTLKDCLCCHIYCAHLGTPWYQIVGDSRTGSNYESWYPPGGISYFDLSQPMFLSNMCTAILKKNATSKATTSILASFLRFLSSNEFDPYGEITGCTPKSWWLEQRRKFPSKKLELPSSSGEIFWFLVCQNSATTSISLNCVSACLLSCVSVFERLHWFNKIASRTDTTFVGGLGIVLTIAWLLLKPLSTLDSWLLPLDSWLLTRALAPHHFSL